MEFPPLPISNRCPAGRVAEGLLHAWGQIFSSAGEGQAQSCVLHPPRLCCSLVSPQCLVLQRKNWISVAVWGQKWEGCLIFAVFVEHQPCPNLTWQRLWSSRSFPSLLQFDLSDSLLIVNGCYNFTFKRKKLFTNFLSRGAENNSKINLNHLTLRKQIDYPDDHIKLLTELVVVVLSCSCETPKSLLPAAKCVRSWVFVGRELGFSGGCEKGSINTQRMENMILNAGIP